MSLVELMIGLAIGLSIVGTALSLALHQLRDDRSMLEQSRLRTELQTVADLVVRDLRRAGYRQDAGLAIARTGAAALADPYAGIEWSDSASTLMLAFSRDAGDKIETVHSKERFGFRLHKGVMEMMIGDGGWQDLTDQASLIVTAFSLQPVVEDLPLGSFCEQPCPATDPSCPRQQVRRYDIALAARSATNAAITRTLSTSARVRNDFVTGACPA